MAWNREYIRNSVKSAILMDRDTDDAHLTNSLINEAIEKAMRKLAHDCWLIPDEKKLALVASQYKYPMEDDVDRIRSVWYIDDTDNRMPLDYINPNKYIDYEDPSETSTEPSYYSYPIMMPHVFEFYAAAPPVYNFVNESWVTTKSIRTIIDSGINFGRTRSGKRVRPKCVGHNLDDDSYGYVEYLEPSTSKVTGTADAGTNSTTLVDAAGDFVNNGVAVDDIICSPSSGVVTKYAFVTAVTATTLTYEDEQPNGSTFSSGDTYKVGVATEARLKWSAPHWGLQDGSQNYFSVGSAKATITGTTFTNTTVTGSSTSGAEAGDIAIAATGEHGYVSAVAANALTVDKWIGGKPADGQTVTVKECDKYQIEDRMATQKCMWIGPTIDASDSIGSESIIIQYVRVPIMPEYDDDEIEIPQLYEQPLLQCAKWQAMKLRGVYAPADVINEEALYTNAVRPFLGNIFAPPINKPLNVWNNRNPRGVRRGETRYTTPNGLRWDL